MEKTGISRRRFLFCGALLAGAVPRGGFGSTPSLRQLGYKSPNEKLNVAAIGAGGRAEINIAAFESENIVAFADPDSDRAANVFSWYEKVPRYADFRRMLDREGKNIDAVVITTPDHTHAVAAMWCMERGKHIYLEKPLTHSVAEARLLTEAAAKYKVATQMGNQGYSNEGTRIACEIIWSGEIGDVTEVHAWSDRPIWPQGIPSLPPEEKVPETLNWEVWLGPASLRPYSSAYLPFNWRGWFDFGTGALGDGACHNLGACNMALRLAAPSSVECLRQEGKSPYTYPKKSTIKFQFPARGAMPPVAVYWYDGATEMMYRPAGIPQSEPLIGGPGSFGQNMPAVKRPARPRTASTKAGPSGIPAFPLGSVFVGSKGFLTTDSYAANVRLLPESRHNEYKLPPPVLTRSPGHYQDWIRACKGGEPGCSNFAISGPFTEWTLLGALAVRLDARLEWDAAKMKVTNNAEANKHIKPQARKGWEIGPA